jgi:hypothetical protein
MSNILLSGSVGVAGSVYILGNASPVIPSDANYTLTTAEYPNLFIKVTSGVSLTATRNIVLPLNAGQLYIIDNATSGGQSIQAIGATGTGATILNGSQKMIYCDGVNYQVVSAGGGGVTIQESHTPTASQTVFTTAATPSGAVQVFVNGIAYQSGGVDYTVSGSTVTWLNTAFTLATTDTVVFLYAPAT